MITEVNESRRKLQLSAPLRIPVEQLDPNYSYRWVHVYWRNLIKQRCRGWKPVSIRQLKRWSKVPLEELNLGTHFHPYTGYLWCGQDLVFCYLPKSLTTLNYEGDEDAEI